MRKLSVLLLALLSTPAFAQDAPAPVVPQFAEIETVEVQAQPGPAVWHVTRGNSEVWILGMVGALPKGLDWNKQYVADLLEGANAILMPPGASVGLLEGTWLLITYGGKLSLPRGIALEATMPADMRARFIATRITLGQDEDRYRTDTPLRAAIRLQQDFSQKSGLNENAMGTIQKLVRDKKVAAKPVAHFEAAPLIRQALDLPLESQRLCLTQTMEDIDRLSAHGATVAEAWAVGDMKRLKANFAESRLMNCLATQTHAFAEMNGSVITAYTDAIDAALNRPGKTIAVIDMGNLLRKGGVLEQLQARHMTIEGPKE